MLHAILHGMVAAADIINAVDLLKRKYHPREIVLFGSYAYGRPTRDSDIDLLILLDKARVTNAESARMRLDLDPTIPFDLIVRSQRDTSRRIIANDFFLREATEKGIKLHASDNPRVGEQGRKRLRRRVAAGSLKKTKSV